MPLTNLIKRIILGAKSLRQPSIAYCVNNNLLPQVLVGTSTERLREQLLLPESPHVTQLNQDIFAILINRFRPGYFVEIGANDGFTLSNTIYLEEHFGWNGLLVEANPEYTDSLKRRKARAVVAAVVDQEGYHEFCNAGLYGGLSRLLDTKYEKRTQSADHISVWGTTLERILEDNGVPNVVNFISIDVEGAEVPIVSQMCNLKQFRFVCGSIEHNARPRDQLEISRLLREADYQVVWEGQTQHDIFFVDANRDSPGGG